METRNHVRLADATVARLETVKYQRATSVARNDGGTIEVPISRPTFMSENSHAS